jgi:hypothetical protein
LGVGGGEQGGQVEGEREGVLRGLGLAGPFSAVGVIEERIVQTLKEERIPP